MAFSSVLLKKEKLPGGQIQETYNYNAASVTTGTITPDTTIKIGKIITIRSFGASSTGNHTVELNTVTTPGSLVLTVTSGDTGQVFIQGPSA